MAQTIRIARELDASATWMWDAVQVPDNFTYVTRGLLSMPAVAGRSKPFQEGETLSGWVFLFHFIPIGRHTIHIELKDDAARQLISREHDRLAKRWDHTIIVEELSQDRCRYTDVVEVDAGVFTGLVAAWGRLFYRYRQRRWAQLAAGASSAPTMP